MKPGAHAHALARRWTLGFGAVVAAIVWIAAGGIAAAGWATGAVIVVVFLSSGLVALRLFGREDVPGGMGLVVFLLAFALRLAVVLFVAALIIRVDLVDDWWLGVGIVACALVWITAHVLHAWRRARTELIVEPAAGENGRSSSASEG